MTATICLVLALVAAQLPARTWTISGRVTDRESGQPLPRARVSIYRGFGVLTSSRPPEMSTVTDAEGGYEFPGVSMGPYTVLAQPPPHVVTHLPQVFGHDMPFGASTRYFVSGASVTAVKSGDVRDINIALPRAVVVEGRVLSDQGDPMAGISVSLIPLANDAPEAPPARVTDDRGAFRLFGAMPGPYRVCATVPALAAQVSAPFRRSCYPHGSDVLELTSSNTNPVEIRMTRARVASVSGIAVDSNGAPLDRGQIQFVEHGTARRRSLPLERAAGGRFVVRNVEPGNYEIVAVLAPESPLDSRERESATVPVTVESTDIDNVTVRTKRPGRVSGIVIFDEGIPEKGSGNMQVMLRVDTPWSMTGPSLITPSAAVKEDLTFELGNLQEPGRVTVIGQPQDWVVKSIVYQGRDIANTLVSFETSSDPRALEIRLTNRVAYVTGHAVADDKRSLMVLLLSADRSRWTTSAGVVAQAGVRPDRSFTVGPVVPGEYLILATTPQAFVETLRDPKSLEGVAARAMRIFLAENDRQELTLYVTEK